MEITGITGDNAAFFAPLCPGRILDDEDSVKIGVIDKDGYAAGICAIKVNDGLARLEWIFTDPEKREQGIGSFLLDNLVILLEDLDLDGIEADYYSSDHEVDFLLSGREFLTGKDGSMFCVPIEDIIGGSEMDRLLESRMKNSNITRLSDKKTIGAVKDYVRAKGLDAGIFNGISPEFSVVNMDSNGKVTGGIFVSEAEKDLHVNYLVNDGSVRGMCEILCGFYDVITEKGKTDSRLIFTDQNDYIANLIEKLTENDREKYAVSDHIYALKLFDR